MNRGGNLSGNTINRGGNTVNINTGGNTTNTGNRANVGNSANKPAQMPANRGNVQNNQAQLPNRAQQNNAARGYGQNKDTGTRSGALSGYSSGGNAAASQARGRASYNGGGAARTGGAARSGGGRKR